MSEGHAVTHRRHREAAASEGEGRPRRSGFCFRPRSIAITATKEARGFSRGILFPSGRDCGIRHSGEGDGQPRKTWQRTLTAPRHRNRCVWCPRNVSGIRSFNNPAVTIGRTSERPPFLPSGLCHQMTGKRGWMGRGGKREMHEPAQTGGCGAVEKSVWRGFQPANGLHSPCVSCVSRA